MITIDRLTTEPPLRMDGDGVLRVGGTRVRLATLIHNYKEGCTAEDLLRKYPSLTDKDVYAAITYYLWHRDELEAYFAEMDQRADKVRKENESRWPPDEWRQGLHERKQARKDH